MNKLALGIIGVISLGVLTGVIVFVSKDRPMNDRHDVAMGLVKGSEPPANSAVQETNEIIYKDFEVMPKAIRIKKGTTVTWSNEDSAKHDVTPDEQSDGFKASELFGKGESYQFTFNTAGTYSYKCAPHPYMKGMIEVVE